MHLIFSPIWFMGIDSTFEILSAIISILVGAYSYKIYRSTGKRQYLYLFTAFALIFLSFLTRAVTDIMAYNLLLEQMPTINTIVNVQYVYLAGIYFYQFLMLSSCMTLAALALKIKGRKIMSLLTFFSLMFAIAGLYNYSIFHIVTSALLFYVVLHFYGNYSEKKTCNALMVLGAFVTIFASHVIFIFIDNPMLYVFGHFLQFAGYLMLLVNLLLVRRT
jgi:hypothetical protein